MTNEHIIPWIKGIRQLLASYSFSRTFGRHNVYCVRYGHSQLFLASETRFYYLRLLLKFTSGSWAFTTKNLVAMLFVFVQFMTCHEWLYQWFIKWVPRRNVKCSAKSMNESWKHKMNIKFTVEIFLIPLTFLPRLFRCQLCMRGWYNKVHIR